MSGLIFKPETHQYFEDGHEYVSVTKMIEAVLQISNPWWGPSGRMRGNFVHKICEVIDKGDWEPETTRFPGSWGEEDIRKVMGRARAYQRFLDESGYVAHASEVKMRSCAFNLAGTADSTGIIYRGAFAGLAAVVDVKSGEPTPAARIQVALYSLMLDENGYTSPTVHVVLHVRENGSPRPEYIFGSERLQDIRDAHSILNVYRFKERNGLLK